MFALRDYQQASITAIRKSFSTGKNCPLLVLPTGAGKCVARGTKILMATGETRCVENLHVGDNIMGVEGFRTIKNTCTGSEEMYTIKPTKGESYTVNESHILSLIINSKCRVSD